MGKSSQKRKREDETNSDEGSSDESTSESEDDGELATEALDSEILATITAIRSRDPRVYDQKTTFFTTASNGEEAPKAQKDKPMHLQDYHRQNLFNGAPESNDEDKTPPLTYDQEQEQFKKTILGEINAATAAPDSEDESGEEEKGNDGFLITKPRVKTERPAAILDVENADKDPETFLSNFMASRAWAEPSERHLHPFESDDEEEERRAEEFEEAYNFRFEDPATSNEKLRSHARDLAAQYSVRREELNPRKRRREIERQEKEAAKQEHREEKARLRKLKMEELEEKVRRIKRAAGLKSQDIRPDDWARLVDDDWDDTKWEEEMQRRFGDEYYAEEDVASEDEGDGEASVTGPRRKMRKPKFDDEIDIKDIVPDFDDEQNAAAFTLSDDDMGAHHPHDADDDGDGQTVVKSSKQRKQWKEEEKKEAKRERRIIEQLVDDQLQLELNNSLPPNSSAGRFPYRETSPKSFGLTARDILLADDRQLNEFAGLKKLASFRDPDKKRKDLKHLGKKARLRKWRLETFGNEDGLPASPFLPGENHMTTQADVDGDHGGVDIRTAEKKRSRRRHKKRKEEGEKE